MDRDHDFAVELGRIVLSAHALEDVLTRVAQVAKRAVEPADEVSLTLLEHGRAPFTIAHTGDLALDADELQYDQGSGPCINAGETGLTLVVSDYATETRWPGYAAAAHERGVGSSLSVPLPVQGTAIGALDVYARATGAFDDPAVVARAHAVASFAAVAVANARALGDAANTAERLAQAMDTRAVVEQAIGVLMGQRGCSAQEAFAVLSRMAEDSSRQLRDVAGDLVAEVSRRRDGP